MSSEEDLFKKLKGYRTCKDLSLRPTPHLKTTFTGFDGAEYPLEIRYYQVQMILHLVYMRRFVVGDDTGLGKTLETIAALCYLWEKDPSLKVVILTTKSATPQWGREFLKFTEGVTPYVCQGTPKKREKVRTEFEQHTDGPTVIVMGYRTAVQDFRHMQDWENYILITDECTAYKNPKTQIHQVCRHLSMQAARVWGMTATLIKNNLLEGYGIYQVVMPAVFSWQNQETGAVHPMTLMQFMHYYCIIEMISIPRSNRKVPKVIGYTTEKVNEFRDNISPFYLGRPKHEVAKELPTLTMKTIEVGLTREQQAKYKEAMDGLLTIGEKSGEAEEKEVTKLTAVTYCQQIVNHPALIDCEGDSEKLKALVDLLTEGDLAGEKVIIFSRFKKMINIIVPTLQKAKIKVVRVTGDESGDQREEAKSKFQNPKDDTNIVCITMAGSDAINLQAAKAIIFYDAPFSAGDYLQILGRMIRIGSIHDRCFAIHLVAGTKTIDHKVLEILQKKMGLLEAVLGKRLKGEHAAVDYFSAKGDVNELFDALREDAIEAENASAKGKQPRKTKKAPTLMRQSPAKPQKTPVKPNIPQKFAPVGEELDLDDLWD